MYLFGYASSTFKLQKILGIEILLPEFTCCFCLSENASTPFLLPREDDHPLLPVPKTTVFISSKSTGKFELKNTPVNICSEDLLSPTIFRLKSDEKLEYFLAQIFLIWVNKRG